MLCMPVCFEHYKCNMPASPTSAMMTDLVVPPFQKSKSAPSKYVLHSILMNYKDNANFYMCHSISERVHVLVF